MIPQVDPPSLLQKPTVGVHPHDVADPEDALIKELVHVPHLHPGPSLEVP